MTIAWGKNTVRALVVSAALVGAALAVPATASGAERCDAWQKSTLATYSSLENIGFDGTGRMLLSEAPQLGPGAIVTRTPAGRTETLASPVAGPGGISVAGSTAYFTTVNSPVSGYAGLTDGTIEAVDLNTGATRTVVRGLTQPNGLAVLPGGALAVSQTVGDSGITLVGTDGRKRRIAAGLTSTNGLWWDTARERLLTATTMNETTVVAAIDPAAPQRWRTVATIPGAGVLNGADDLTADADGNIYVALSTGMKVLRIDAQSGRQCVVADGLPAVSSVRFGSGPGWDAASLYATTLLGGLYKLSPRA